MTAKGKGDTMVTNDGNKVALRKLRKTTHVRVWRVDVKVLDDICFMLRVMEPSVHYTRSDAVSYLIGWAQVHEHLPLSTPQDLYTGTE